MTDKELLELADRIEALEIKALSIRQPYPHHIFYDGKDVENRDWPTKGRGWFFIHASKSEVENKALIRENDMPLGGIVGMARIVDCVDEMDSEWFYGKYGFVLADAFPMPIIPCKGKLSFFNIEQDVATIAAATLRVKSILA